MLQELLSLWNTTSEAERPALLAKISPGNLLRTIVTTELLIAQLDPAVLTDPEAPEELRVGYQFALEVRGPAYARFDAFFAPAVTDAAG